MDAVFSFGIRYSVHIFEYIDCKSQDMYDNIGKLVFDLKMMFCFLQSACVQHSHDYTRPLKHVMCLSLIQNMLFHVNNATMLSTKLCAWQQRSQHCRLLLANSCWLSGMRTLLLHLLGGIKRKHDCITLHFNPHKQHI